MRILTVRQPWAHAIIHGGKTVENRARNIAGDYRGEIAIHAGLARDDRGWVESEAYMLTRTMNRGYPDALGAIIGVVRLWAVHPDTGGACCSNAGRRWGQRGAWHLCLTNPRALAEPIPYKGALGLRHLDDDTTARILAQIGATS
jgi:hypothetical protein